MLKALKILLSTRHCRLAFISFALVIMCSSTSSYGEVLVYGDSVSYRIEMGDTTFFTIYDVMNLVISQGDSIEVIACSENGVDFEPSIEFGRILYGFPEFDSLSISFIGYGYLNIWGTGFFALNEGIGPPDSLEWID